MDKRRKIIDEIFKTVYDWGQAGVDTNAKAPTFQKLIKKLEALNEPEDKPQRIEERLRALEHDVFKLRQRELQIR